MNERILELADQAAEGMAGLNIPDEFCIKFAELIVWECVMCMYRHRVEGFGILEERILKEHFGVEL
jgi:hypothetical protein